MLYKQLLFVTFDEETARAYGIRTQWIDSFFSLALAAAIMEAEPKAQRFTLPAATIHDRAELDAWLSKSRAEIEMALEYGPVIL